MEINTFLDWSALGTFAGACLAVNITTQAFKETFKGVPTRLVSYLAALILLIGAAYFNGANGNIGEYLICPVNAVLVSFASNGAFDFIKSVSDDPQENDHDSYNT